MRLRVSSSAAGRSGGGSRCGSDWWRVKQTLASMNSRPWLSRPTTFAIRGTQMNHRSIAASLRAMLMSATLLVLLPGMGWCDVKEDLIQLENKRNDALVAGDWATYDALLGDEFFHAH